MQFWGYFNFSRKHFHIEFNFKQKKYDLFEEQLKKSNFFNFLVKIIASDHLFLNVCFSNLCQKILKLSSPVLWKGFEIKSHQRRAHYLNSLRNGGRLAARGGSRSPLPVWLGLKGSNYTKSCRKFPFYHNTDRDLVCMGALVASAPMVFEIEEFWNRSHLLFE